MTGTELKDQIERIVERDRDEIVGALSTILKSKTVSGATDADGLKAYDEGIAECLAYLEARAGEMGFAWRNHGNRVAVAELPFDGDFVGLPVHIDVVPAGDGWSHGPFSGDIADGFIWGRGAQDNKGPVVQMLWAMKVLGELGVPLKRGARLIVGTAEECGDWEDIAHYFEMEPAPAIAVVPDADFPIVNGEKGILNLQVKVAYATDHAPDVGGFRFQSACSGQRSNIVPDRAELVLAGAPGADVAPLRKELDRFLAANPKAKAELGPAPSPAAIRIVFQGKSVHGSRPHEGHNAAVDLLLFLSQSGFVSDDEADLAQFLHDGGADLRGEAFGIQSSHPFIGPTTVSLGILKWETGVAEVVYNVRNTLGMPGTEALSKVRGVVGSFGAELGFDTSVEPTSFKVMDAVHVDEAKHPEFVGALREAYTTVTGHEFKLRAIGGTTYAKVFANAVCFGPTDPPGELDLAHQKDERVATADHLRNVKIYAFALARLCGA